jgi:hypothetical protein
LPLCPGKNLIKINNPEACGACPALRLKDEQIEKKVIVTDFVHFGLSHFVEKKILRSMVWYALLFTKTKFQFLQLLKVRFFDFFWLF